MYKDHFELRAMPFSITPDTRYFYLSNPHRDALTHLRHAVDGQDGIVLLTGDIGTGKTTVCRRLLDELPPHVDVALIVNPRLTAAELLQAVHAELQTNVDTEGAELPALHDTLRQHLDDAARKGRHSILVIDEAQNLQADAVEQLVRLSTLREAGRLLLQIVLIGQPELNEQLESPRLRELDGGIAMRFHLGPLAPAEVGAYVRHRLSVAGATGQAIPRRLMGKLHRLSQGVPRVINLICDRSLLGAYVLGKRAVSGRILGAAAREALGEPPRHLRWKRWALASAGGLALVAASVSLAVSLRETSPRDVPTLGADAPNVSIADLDPLDPSDWPDGMTGPKSRSLAFEAVFKRWKAPYRTSAPPCDQDGGKGLRCVQGKDELDEVRRLNLPAVLQLMDRRGRETDVALVGFKGGKAVVQLGELRRMVSIATLEAQWTRHYTLLWRAPPRLRAGGAGSELDRTTAAWLGARLAKLNGVDAASLPDRMEDSLRNSLKDFQMAEGLSADGGADLRTLVRLAMRTDPEAPLLENGCGR